jgi:hypothetical protein
MTEYHKIETLYERDEKTHKLKEPLALKNPVYGIIKTFEWHEKVDGTNIRVAWNHVEKKTEFGGRTDNAQIDSQLYKWMADTFTPAKLEAVFPDADAVLYGEGCGAGIQKGGIYSPTKIVVLFDVLVITSPDAPNANTKWWLSRENVLDVASKLGVTTAPYVGEMTLDEATDMVREGFNTRLGAGEGQAEGLIGRPVEALFDKKGARIIVKLKTKDFAPRKRMDGSKDQLVAPAVEVS